MDIQDLPNENCPRCGELMKVRIKLAEHINKHIMKLSKHKYFQYYCQKCDDDETGWTTTTSDKLSINPSK